MRALQALYRRGAVGWEEVAARLQAWNAHAAHGESSAVRAFEAVYVPELVGGPVIFTDYLQVATNS